MVNIEKIQKIQIDHYRKKAEAFDDLYSRDNPCHRRKINFISEFLKIKNGDKVLEVGIGTGIHAKWLLEMQKEHSFYFFGCDLSPEMIEESRKKLNGFSKVELLICPGESLSYENNSMDKAYISGSLHHFADKRKGVEELVRVVRSDGIIVISEPNIFCPTNAIQVIRHFKTEFGQLHTHPWALRKLFSGLPVEIISQRFFNFTPPFPKFFMKILDKVDIFLAEIPFIRYISSMSLIVVKKI